MTSGMTYLGSGTVDVENENTGEIFEGIWKRDFSMPSIINAGSNHSAKQARELRDRYKHYFTHEGIAFEYMIYISDLKNQGDLSTLTNTNSPVKHFCKSTNQKGNFINRLVIDKCNSISFSDKNLLDVDVKDLHIYYKNSIL